MNRCERASWFDTEGSLNPGRLGKGDSKMVITQNEKKPLLDYIAGAKTDCVRCSMRYERSTRTYFVVIQGLENIAKELNLLLPYIRTNKKLKQISRFRRYLLLRRTKHQHQASRALDILNGVFGRDYVN